MRRDGLGLDQRIRFEFKFVWSKKANTDGYRWHRLKIWKEAVGTYAWTSWEPVVFQELHSLVKRAVGEECLAGGLLQEDRAVAEEVVDLISPFKGDEEEFALAFAPDRDEIGGREEDARGVGKG